MALSTYTPGFLSPSPDLVPTAQNFKSLYNFATWHLPDVKNALVKRFANESLTGMLEALGYEQGFSSDKHVWGEEGRMFRAYSGAKIVGDGTANQLTITGHALRVKEVIEIFDQDGNSDTALITAVPDANTITVSPYTVADLSGFDTDESSGDLFVHVIGAEQKKGGDGMSGGVTRDYDIYSIKPIIIPGAYEINNSDVASIGWLTDGQNPFWYIEDMEYDRARFLSTLEKQMILSRSVEAASGLEDDEYGTAGLFEQLEERGNNFEGAISEYADLKNIIKRLDKQSGERYNMFFTSRDQKFKWDEIFASLNPNQTSLVNYGAFQNGKDMALDLGFNGFTWGGYEFYAQTWKMLINPTALGSDNIPAASKIHGVMLPMGETMASTGAKYQDISQNSREAINYITMMYREMPGYSRKFEEWVTGSGRIGVPTNKEDKTTINYRTERAIRLAGANKAFFVKGSAS